MAEIKTLYATPQALTVTGLGTLANAASVVSNAVSNNTDKYLDALVFLTVQTGGSATATGVVEVYVKASHNNVDFDDDYNDKWVGTLVVGVAGAQTRLRGMSIASGFQGTMPNYWKIRIRNASGAALTDASVTYQGVSGQSV